MKFLIVEPAKKIVRIFEHDYQGNDISPVMREAGLKPGAVDFGMVTGKLAIIVAEYGLEANPDQQPCPYFALGGHLYAGNAVLFGADNVGGTVDVPELAVEYSLPGQVMRRNPSTFVWFDGLIDIEAAIFAGIVDRPIIAFNGVVLGMWPWKKSPLRSL